MRRALLLVASAVLGLAAGCHRASSARSAPAPAGVAVAAEMRVDPRPVVVARAPRSPAPVAQLADPSDPARAVYSPPKIVKTVLAAYEDEKGRLFGPQDMYEKVEEGRFNVAALENPELAYIPPENLVVPPGLGNPVALPVMRQRAAEAGQLPLDLFDGREVVPTGLFSAGDNRAEAERLAARQGRRAVYDPDLGWLLVPGSTSP